MLNLNPKTIAACNINLHPVHCERGRKWRGALAYSIDLGNGASDIRSGSFGTLSEKLWEPVSKKFVYANVDFIFYYPESERDESKIAADKVAYIESTVQETIDWCKSAKPNLPEAEMKQFIRNVLKKHHPEMLPVIDVLVPDNRDVVAEVQKTLQWAMTLKTQACWLYGRYCAGGKPISDERKVNAAYKALCKKGIDKLDGFNEAWQMMLDVMGLPHIQQ